MCISECSACSIENVPESKPLIIIVGGESSLPHLQRLELALPGYRINHVSTRKTDSSSRRFDNAFQDPHIKLVVVVIGLCRTQHSKDAIRLARLCGTTWTSCRRLPHPSRLQAILATRLRGGRS